MKVAGQTEQVVEQMGSQLDYLSQAVGFNAWMFSQYEPFIRWGKVWEIGSGTGNMSSYLLKADLAMLTEYDDGYRAVLEKRYAGQPKVRVEKVDLINLDVEHFRSFGFDTIISTNVLEHIPDDKAAIQAITATMKPETVMITLVPAHPFLYGTMDKAVGHFRRYTRKGLIQLLEGAGHQVEEAFFFNRVSALGWFLKFRLFRRPAFAEGDIALVEKLLPLLKLEKFAPLPFGQSLIAVSRKKR